MRLNLNTRKLAARIAKRTAEIEVGKTYFLSSFYDKDGATVRVLAKSTKVNKAGWASTVNVEVLEPVGDPGSFYDAGKLITCNATNLYDRRADASPAAKFGRAS